MKWHTWEDLHGELQSCQWLAHVGEPLDLTPPNLQLVSSWDLAREWASAEISWWCANEASNILRLHLSNNHRAEYRQWNEHIKTFAANRDKLLERTVSPLLPERCQIPKVVDWIRSHLRSYQKTELVWPHAVA